MAFDSIDKIFNDMLKRYSKFFGQDMFDDVQATPNKDLNGDADEFEHENDYDSRDEPVEPHAKSRKFGYEIISGSDLKEPIVRIYGNPDEFPELKDRLEGFLKQSLGSFLDKQGLPMERASLDELETPAINTPEASAKEPFSESFKEKDGRITVNVDLPGVKESDVSVKVDGKTLRVEANGENRHYQKSIELDNIAETKDLSWRLNNGVLEIKIRAAVS
jgi:HSP20 family molecular chaperone IbpA